MFLPDWIGRCLGLSNFIRGGLPVPLFVVFVGFRQAPVGVGAGMDFRESLDVDVGVDLSGVKPGVTQHFLHIADVCPALMHIRCTRVTPQVTRTFD